MPDKKHPYGHGRVEYLSAMLIAIIILYAGATSLIESIKKIITPIEPEYSSITIIIVSVAIVVKIVLGLYVKSIGKKVNSESLVNSGTDALMDSIISISTLIAVIVYLTANISLEAYLGAIISIVIIKSGIEMLKSTISQILGERVDSTLSKSIKKTVCSFKEVRGAYDLILNNYGPDIFIGSIHIEVSDEMTACEIDELTRKISHKVYEEDGVILSAVGIYSINVNDEETISIINNISKIIHSYKSVLQMHGFYLNKKDKTISFDIILDYDDPDKRSTYGEILAKVQSEYPDYGVSITLDFDVSD